MTICKKLTLLIFFGGWVSSDEAFLSLRSDDLDMDVVLAGKEEALADWEVTETLALFIGEFKDIGKNIDGGAGLLKK